MLGFRLAGLSQPVKGELEVFSSAYAEQDMHETTFPAKLFREKPENFGRGERVSWQYGRIVS